MLKEINMFVLNGKVGKSRESPSILRDQVGSTRLHSIMYYERPFNYSVQIQTHASFFGIRNKRFCNWCLEATETKPDYWLIRFELPGGAQMFEFEIDSKKFSVPMISAMKAERLLSSGCMGYLANIVDMGVEPLSKPEEIEVVREFLDVFLRELI